MREDLVEQSTEYGCSDHDEVPARQFHAKFIALLKQLKYNKADKFCVKHFPVLRKDVKRSVPPEAQFFDGSDSQNRVVRLAWFPSLMGGSTVSDVTKNDDGAEFVVDRTEEPVECVRLADVKARAMELCRRLMVSEAELAAGWDENDIPLRPVRTERDIAAWLKEKLGRLIQMAATFDGDEPLVNAEELRRIVKEYEQSDAYQQNQKAGRVVNPNDPSFVAFAAAMRPIDEFLQSDRFWIGLQARQDSSVERLLHEVIRAVEVWLEAKQHIEGRPAMLPNLDRADEQTLRAHVLELSKYLAELSKGPKQVAGQLPLKRWPAKRPSIRPHCTFQTIRHRIQLAGIMPTKLHRLSFHSAP